MLVSIVLAAVTLLDVATLPLVYLLATLGGVTLVFDASGRQTLDLPDGRPARASERGRAQLRALQRLTGHRPDDRGRA